MNIKKLYHIKEKSYTDISGFFSAYGDFGVVDGIDSDTKKLK